MPPHRTLLAALLVLSLLTAGCIKQVAKTLRDLESLNSGLTKKFGDDVHVHLNEGDGLIVTITFINSALNDRGPQERSVRAVQTAQFVKERFPRIQSVAEMWVVFVRRKTSFVVFHQTQSFEVYGFDKNGDFLAPPGTPGGPPPSTLKNAPTAGYTSASDETNISVNTIQLEGEPGGYGLTVLPHFKLQGDATTRKAPPPAEVSFFMASYSKKPRFSKEVPIVFIADGKPVAETKATFTGKDAQYCSPSVSYSAFSRMIAAKGLTIKVGAKEYPLTPEEFEALQQMDVYVRH